MNPVRAFYYVYVLQSRLNGQNYTGFTADLKKRFTEHQDGKSRYTRTRRPYDLIYYEACLNKDDARAREKYLKTGLGKRYLNNRMKCYREALTG